MNSTSPISALRTRWWLVPLLIAVGAALAAIPTPARVGTSSANVRYRATHTMLLNNPDSSASSNGAVAPSQVPLFATAGDVPERVKEKIGYSGNAAQLATEIEVTFDPRVISYEKLLEVFFREHDPTTRDAQGNDVGPQYRSVIFFHSASQRLKAEAMSR